MDATPDQTQQQPTQTPDAAAAVPKNAAPQPPAQAPATPAPAPKATPETPAAPAPAPAQAPETPAAPAPAPAVPAAMSAEIDSAMQQAMQQPAASPSKPAAIRGPRRVEAGREHRKGMVVSVGEGDIFIEFGPKELGIAPKTGWPEAETPKPGDQIDVVVDRYDANEQVYACSRPGAVQKAAWEELQPGQVVQARVTGVNKGGLELEVAKHRAFMPASQADVHHVPDLSVFVGETLRCAVKKVERAGRGNIVLSRRDVMQEERKGSLDKLRGELKEGDVREGVVVRTADFGAFVDLGGADGLVHISDLSHNRVRSVEDVVKAGDTVKVKVVKLDWDKDRIGLSIKETTEDPYETAHETVAEGEIVTGKVTKVLDFGAFVEVAPGVEGLVHISELDWKRVQKVEHVLKPDQVVQVKVLAFDKPKRKLSLSVKQTKDAPKNMKAPEGRSAEEIQKETPQLRRMREQFKQKKSTKKHVAGDSGGGLGNISDFLGEGLGSIKL